MSDQGQVNAVEEAKEAQEILDEIASAVEEMERDLDNMKRGVENWHADCVAPRRRSWQAKWRQGMLSRADFRRALYLLRHAVKGNRGWSLAEKLDHHDVALRARIEELEEALRPFALAGDVWVGDAEDYPDETEDRLRPERPVTGLTGLEVGDLLRARALLDGANPKPAARPE